MTTSLPRPSQKPRAELRRLTLELIAIVVLKLALLMALYYALLAPQPRADTSPGAIQKHLLDPANEGNHLD